MLDPADSDSRSAEPSARATNHRLLASAAVLGVATVLVRLVSFGREWLVAKTFGAGDELDAFLIAFLIPSFAVNVVGQSFSIALVPRYVHVLEHQGPAAARRLLSGILFAGMAVLMSASLLLAATAPLILPWIAWGFSPRELALAKSLFYLVVAVLLMSGVSAIFTAVLAAHERFIMPAAAPLAVPLTALIVLAAGKDRWGIYALAGGTMLGFVVECILLGAALAWHGLLAWPRAGDADQNLKHIGWQYASLATGGLLMSSATFVDQSMAASLGSGNVSVLSYGSKIVALVLSMVAVSLGTVFLPRFSRMIAARQWDELQRTVCGLVLAVALLSVPTVALLALLSEPLIRLIFERGAFTPETTTAVNHVQLCYLLQIPFYVLALLGSRLLSALDANRIVLRISALNLALNIVGNIVFMHWFGIAGIALATSLAYLVNCLATLWTVRRKLSEARQRP